MMRRSHHVSLKQKEVFKLLLLFSCLQLHSPQVKTDSSLRLTKENVRNYLAKVDVQYKDIVYAQILLESNSLKSKLCKQKNNLLGMHCTTLRPSTALKHTKGYASYENWQKSIDDYVLFQQRLFRKRVMSKSQYLAYLNRNYAETGHYAKKVMEVMKHQMTIPIAKSDSVKLCYICESNF